MAARQPKKKPPNLATVAREGGFVAVEVGPDRTCYQVHKALLTHHSEFFRAALSRTSQQAENRKVILEDVEPAIFNIFTNWLYTGALPMTYAEWVQFLNENAEGTVDPADSAALAAYVSLAQLKSIHLGNRVSAQGFTTATHNQYVDTFLTTPEDEDDTIPHYTSIAYMYKMLDEHCKLRDLRDLAAELFACRWNGIDDDENVAFRANVPVEFFVLVTRKLIDRVGGNYPDPPQRCDYHIYCSGQEHDTCFYYWLEAV